MVIINVNVPADFWFDEEGCMLPHVIIWEDGKIYELDKTTHKAAE